jgi:hypothetical protein
VITEADYQTYLETLRQRFPRFKVIPKSESRLNGLIDRALRLVTAGGQSSYMSHYVTTLGARIYTPTNWDERPSSVRYCVMRHEAVHIAQFKRYGWVGMTLLYVLLPLPFGFAAGRAWLEWEAYKETVIATWQVAGRDAARSDALRADIVRRFTGPDYGWMWLRGRTIERALTRHLMALEACPPEPLDAPGP